MYIYPELRDLNSTQQKSCHKEKLLILTGKHDLKATFLLPLAAQGGGFKSLTTCQLKKHLFCLL